MILEDELATAQRRCANVLYCANELATRSLADILEIGAGASLKSASIDLRIEVDNYELSRR